MGDRFLIIDDSAGRLVLEAIDADALSELLHEEEQK